MPVYKENAFMSFCWEWRRANDKDRGMPLSQVVNQCDILWRNMSKEERGVYQVKVKATLSPEPEDISKKMKLLTEALVMEAVDANDLANAKLVFVHFNHFAKTGVHGDSYVPAEFSACAFSLKHGIESSYHTLINPGPLELGQAHYAQLHSSTTHRLPLPPDALGEANLTRASENINSFLKCALGCKIFLLFSDPNVIPEVMSCFSKLGMQNVQVAGIDYLLFFLKKQVYQIARLPVDNICNAATKSFLQNDMYKFSPGLACQFHDNIDREKDCSLSFVKRWAYSFCEYLCKDLDLTMKPGKHIPGVQKDNESSMEVPVYPGLAGFGRGRGRGRLPTLGEAKR